MTLLTKRQRRIIMYLMEQNQYCTISKLASQFRVSTRTIRYDLNSIEDWLSRNRITLLKKPGKGIKIGNIENKKQIIDKAISNIEQIVLSIEERRYLILIYLFLTKGNITIKELSDKLYVSKNTIISDMDYLENILKINSIQLERKPHYGISIKGNELHLRKYFIRLINDWIEKNYLGNQGINKLFSDLIIDDFINLVESYGKQMNVKYTEEAKKELLITLLVSVKRLLLRKLIEVRSQEINLESKEYKIMKNILENITNKYKAKFNESECAYLTKIFVGAKRRNEDKTQLLEEVDFEVTPIINSIIQDIYEYLGLDLSEDVEFNNALKIHLQIAVYRLKNNLEITNPLTEKIKYTNPFIFDITKKIIAKCEGIVGTEFPDDEIAYIAMHIGATFERHKQSGFMPRVLVVCGSGLATSNLLKTRLNIMLPEIKLIGPVAINEVDEIIKENSIDFIVSTTKLSIRKPRVIVVNPLLENEDIYKLKTLIFKTTKKKQLMYLSKQSISETQEKIILKDILDKESVILNYSCKDWRQGIKVASKPLLDKKCITNEYVEAIIKAVEELGPYMVIIPEIVLAHASPEKGVFREGMSLLTLKEPIYFADKNREIVKILIVFCTDKLDRHIDILSRLVRILEKEENINILKDAKKYEEIINLSNIGDRGV